MTISVIIASYNQCSTLRRAINSVLSQILPKGVDLQVIVIDDGSTDGSQDIEKEYVDVVWVNKKHEGIMSTYNTGLLMCRGEYIAFCDCDDYWYYDLKLAKQYCYMENNNDCGLCTTRVYTRSGFNLTHEDVSTDDINSNLSYDTILRGSIPIHAQSYFIRKSVLDKHVIFTDFVNMGFNTWDYPIILELIHHTRFHCLDFYSAVFVKRTESTTNTESRTKRVKYLIGNYKIKLYYIMKYGCQKSTVAYLLYILIRNVYSIIFKRWVR